VGCSGKWTSLGTLSGPGDRLVWGRGLVWKVDWSDRWTGLDWTGLGRRLLWGVDWSGNWPNWTGPGKWANLGNGLVRVSYLVEKVDWPGT
jgi:hypothetical protein